MAIVSLMLEVPASMAVKKMAKKWTSIPMCFGIAVALSLMAVFDWNPKL